MARVIAFRCCSRVAVASSLASRPRVPRCGRPGWEAEAGIVGVEWSNSTPDDSSGGSGRSIDLAVVEIGAWY